MLVPYLLFCVLFCVTKETQSNKEVTGSDTVNYFGNQKPNIPFGHSLLYNNRNTYDRNNNLDSLFGKEAIFDLWSYYFARVEQEDDGGDSSSLATLIFDTYEFISVEDVEYENSQLEKYFLVRDIANTNAMVVTKQEYLGKIGGMEAYYNSRIHEDYGYSCYRSFQNKNISNCCLGIDYYCDLYGFLFLYDRVARKIYLLNSYHFHTETLGPDGLGHSWRYFYIPNDSTILLYDGGSSNDGQVVYREHIINISSNSVQKVISKMF